MQRSSLKCVDLVTSLSLLKQTGSHWLQLCGSRWDSHTVNITVRTRVVGGLLCWHQCQITALIQKVGVSSLSSLVLKIIDCSELYLHVETADLCFLLCLMLCLWLIKTTATDSDWLLEYMYQWSNRTTWTSCIHNYVTMLKFLTQYETVPWPLLDVI